MELHRSESTVREKSYRVIKTDRAAIKAWTDGVAVEPEAEAQLRNIAQMPFIFRWVAVMPDVHKGMGATVGSVIPTKGAVIPAAVGVDIGCGMMAVRTSLTASQLPDSLRALRTAIEAAVPHGRTANGGPGDRGTWHEAPARVTEAWGQLAPRFSTLCAKHPRIARGWSHEHLGTLGTGNHFIEVCLDEADAVWFMLHSGSRGVGNRIGSYFIELAKQDMRRHFIHLPDDDLSYLCEGTQHFDEYVEAVSWAQDFAALNRELMMMAVVDAARGLLPPFEARLEAVNCHHNYISREHHFGHDVLVTRKGAVRARRGDLGIIPGSMGARSYIVRGRGNDDSFHSCSHGAGRAMSRTAAKKKFTLADHAAATAGIECRQDEDVIDETPMAYKPIDDVMHAQRDLVEVVHTLRQVVCVKG
ncbi:MAG: RtcB family protein [Myxococcales bacterium]|nr:MAG: RtcB family protein [Myxococcales bacterium]